MSLLGVRHVLMTSIIEGVTIKGHVILNNGDN